MSEETVKEFVSLATSYGMNIIGGVVILIIGWMIAEVVPENRTVI